MKQNHFIIMNPKLEKKQSWMKQNHFKTEPVQIKTEPVQFKTEPVQFKTEPVHYHEP